MAYTPPNIWYSQDNNLSRAIDSLNQLANEFLLVKEEEKKIVDMKLEQDRYFKVKEIMV